MRLTSMHRVLVLASLFLAATGAADQTWLNVSVQGQRLSVDDLTMLYKMAFGLPKPVEKSPAEMPAYAPYVSYQGKDSAGKPVVWYAHLDYQTTNAHHAEIQEEQFAAAFLASLDQGVGTPALLALYAEVPKDPQDQERFGLELGHALQEWSDQTVTHSDADRQWIFAHLHDGMTRSEVNALLLDHGLKLEPNPKGPAIVELQYAFAPGCGFTRNVEIKFDQRDTLYAVDLSQPKPDCL